MTAPVLTPEGLLHSARVRSVEEQLKSIKRGGFAADVSVTYTMLPICVSRLVVFEMIN